jgi:integral membrane sensor domain MASE1
MNGDCIFSHPATMQLPSFNFRSLGLTLFLAGVYIATARLGLTLALPPEAKATAVWPPSGIAFAAVVLVGRRAWPGILLGAFLANFWDYFSGTDPRMATHFVVSAGIAVGSTAQALLGGWLVQRWIGGSGILDRTRSAFRFMGIALLVCVVASTTGVTTMCLVHFAPWAHYGFNWRTWWVGDTIGILVVTPLVLVWSRRPRLAGKSWLVAEAGLLWLAVLGLGLCIFERWDLRGIDTGYLAYLTIPPLVWAAFRFGRYGATATLVLMSGLAVLGTAQGHGPFVRPTLNQSLLLLQMFVGVLTVTTLALVADLAERRQAKEEQAHLMVQLFEALEEIKTICGLIPVCAWCKKVRTDTGAWEQMEYYLSKRLEATFTHGVCPQCTKKIVEEEGLDEHPPSNIQLPSALAKASADKTSKA